MRGEDNGVGKGEAESQGVTMRNEKLGMRLEQ
jgi:hypothetical protein